MPGKLLSSKTETALQQAINYIRRMEEQTTQSKTDDAFIDGDPTAPQFYIGLPDSPAGIPGMTGDGLGTGSGADNEPGSAYCHIYRVDGSGLLVPVPNFRRKVFNYSTHAVSQDFIAIARDAYGTWIALTGSSASLWGKLMSAANPWQDVNVQIYSGHPGVEGGTNGETETDEVRTGHMPGIALPADARVLLVEVVGYQSGILQILPLECGEAEIGT